jgi:2-dehydropantoate 2-reductase
METDPRYVIVGAGAIGNAIGGQLSAAGSSVLFVARPAIANAIRTGLMIRRQGSERVIKAPAVTDVTAITPASSDVVIITLKSQHTEAVVEQLAAVYNRSAPIICMQNGVGNEEAAARRFDRVYAGLVLLTAVQLDPSLVTITVGKTLAVGRYPEGEDAVVSRVCQDLTRAGFEAISSRYVMAMKWGKLVANLNNATHAITGYWLERALAEPEMRRLMVDVREEGLRVLDSAGIAVEPPEREPSPIRIRQETEKMKGPPRDLGKALSMPESERGYPSMWQDLYLGRETNEADLLNGEIVRLGKKLGIPTPYNETLLNIINRMNAERRKPGLYTPSKLRAVIEG